LIRLGNFLKHVAKHVADAFEIQPSYDRLSGDLHQHPIEVLHHLPLLEEIITLDIHRLPAQLDEVDDLGRIGPLWAHKRRDEALGAGCGMVNPDSSMA
jgi:hypothetical protein